MLDLESVVPMDGPKGILDNAHNVCAIIPEEDRQRIGAWVAEQFTADRTSRTEWEANTAESLKLAMQVVETKSFPWEGAANVKFPLLTIGALQYHSRAYPALLPSETFVHCRVIGDDPDGKKSERAHRVSQHMSYQLSEMDTAWEEHTDKSFIVQSIIGCAFKKTYYDSFAQTPISELVFPQDLVLDYYTKSLEKCPRVTHVYPMWKNDVVQRQRSDLFCEPEDLVLAAPQADPMSGPLSDARNVEQGLQPSDGEDTPYTFLEQHCYMDLDDDGYAEPYICFVRADTKALYRIVPRFRKASIRYSKDSKVIESIAADQYFTKIPFVPAPDGGFYDMGFGLLLGSTNEAINTIFNQLLDAGTMSNTGGGFLARGVRVMGGEYSFRPNEWKRTDSTPEQMKNGIVPLPVREPSMVLFNLLGLLIDFGQRIGMATDPMTGVNPGQNTPAETSRNTIAQGEKVFNGIYKRTWRALKEEFRKVYLINNLNPPKSGKWEFAGGEASMTDYYETERSIVPTADPHVASDTERVQQAMMLAQRAQTTPGYDRQQVELRVLSALKIPGPQQVYPGIEKMPPPPNPKVQIEQMRQQTEMAKLQASSQSDAMDMMETRRLNTAKIYKLVAEAEKLKAQAASEETNKIVGMLNAEIGMARQQDEQLKTHLDAIFRQMDHLHKAHELHQNQQQIDMAQDTQAPA